MVVKLFFFYKDVDKFCNSLAELYSNVSKVGDFSSINTCIMNKLYLNVLLRAAAGSYVNFIWKKRFFYDCNVGYNCNNTGDYDGNVMTMIKKMNITMMMMIIFHSRRNYVCFNPF